MPIVNVAAIARTLDLSCAACATETDAVPLATLALINPGGLPGQSGVAFTCPACGAVECFNTNLGPEDEGAEWRGTQARRIRALMLLLALQRRNVQIRGG